MSTPTVSVVIPCYNAARFVADAVESVWAQTRPVHEIICVDDGSTDATLETLRSLERRSPVPFHVLTGANGGPSFARNKGTKAARGDYIQYLDADDLLAPDKLAHQLDLCERTPPPDLVVASYSQCSLDDYCAHTPPKATDPDATEVPLDEDLWAGLLTARLGITSANLWRRQAVVRVGGWDETRRTSEDPGLVFRLMRDGSSVVRDPVSKTLLRRRPDSQWRHDSTASSTGWLELRGRIVRHLNATGELTDERHRAVSDAAFRHVRSLYPHRPAFAREMHRTLVRPSYRPPPGLNGAAYRAAYALLGFGAAERLALWWHGALGSRKGS